MSEPIAVVTIKLTEAELKLINEMIGHHISDWQEKEKLMPAKYNLQKELLKIEDWVNEEKQASVNDKRVSEKSSKEQTKLETLERSSISFDD